MYTSYSGKSRTDSNSIIFGGCHIRVYTGCMPGRIAIARGTSTYTERVRSVRARRARQRHASVAWRRPQSNPSRVEDELMEKSARALESVTNPLEKLRLLCLTRGASGILVLGRIFRKMDDDGSKQLNKEKFLTGIKHTGLDISHEEAEELFAQLDVDNTGSISVDEFIKEIRPPMSAGRRAIVEQAFRKLDKSGEGIIAIEDLRGIYSVDANPRYKSGEETEDLIMNKFLANFETEGEGESGQVTLEEFMNYYSGISVSMDNDCYFDLVMRQFYKL